MAFVKALLGVAVVALLGCAGRAKEPSAEARRAVRSSFQLDDSEVSVHLPAQGVAPLRGVILLHSAMGRSDAVLAQADSLAEHGYGVYALDFFRGKVARDVAEGRALRDDANQRAPELARLVGDAYERLATDPRIGASRRFLIGASYGAAWATHMAGKLQNVAGIVAFYGESFTSETGLDERVTAPVLLIGATADPESTPSALNPIVEKLRARGVDASSSFARAGHGFAEALHPGFNPSEASRTWSDCLTWLAHH